MYLAKIRQGSELRYCIRQSYFDTQLDAYSYRDVFDLGQDPAGYVERLSENSICFAEQLEDAVAEAAGQDPTRILEELLWDFIPADVRLIMEQFKKKTYAALSPLSPEERQEIERSIHIFDRRRLFYIRYGAVDQSRIFRVNEKLYRPLLYKSRDEREHYIQALEKSLRPDEIKKYIFVIFNLQRSFSESYAVFMPEALAEEEIADVLMEEICRLNDDPKFWQDGEISPFLREHLQPYLIAFFDSQFTRRSYDYDFYRSFREAHRRFKWPERKPNITEEETSEVFGKSMSELKGMSLKELRKTFRKQAKEYHPDSGGKAEDFIKLIEAYESLKIVIKKK